MNSGKKTLYALEHNGEYRFFYSIYERDKAAKLIRSRSYKDIITYFDIPLTYENMQIFLEGVDPDDNSNHPW